MKVAVAVEGDVTTRAAHALATHDDVDVVLLGPTTSARFQVIDDPTGCDAVVGLDRAKSTGRQAGIPAVTATGIDSGRGIGWCSPPGLARALAADLPSPGTVAVAVPDDPGGQEQVVFPSPIDARKARPERVGDSTVWVAGGDGPLAAALAIGTDLHRVVLDDHRFMEAITLAAGVGILLGGHRQGSVWEFAGDYLATATEMGLVIGERSPTN